MQRSFLKRLPALVLAVQLLVACSIPTSPNPEPSSDPVPAALQNTHWKLLRLSTLTTGETNMSAAKITLNFENKRVSGYGGCNTYGGDIRLDQPQAQSLSFANLQRTLLGCPGEPGLLEEKYMRALEQTQRYALKAGQLILYFEGEGSLTYNPAEAPKS